MTQYEDLLRDVLKNGFVKTDRTGVGTLSTFGHMLKFNLSEGFPLVTTKKIHFKSVVYELLWFLQGATNIQFLKENGVTIWDEWADENGELGPIYGFQWRSWPTPDGKSIDQISKAIYQIKNSPDSRRIIVNAWNVADIEKMSLPPCHVLFQFYVSEGKLSCLMFQRSCDLFLGVPFNIASFALLTHMFAHVCELEVGEFVHFFGDTHIYLNHLEQVKTQLERTPRKYPTLKINRKVNDIFDFKYEDFSLDGYNPHPAIKAPIAV